MSDPTPRGSSPQTDPGPRPEHPLSRTPAPTDAAAVAAEATAEAQGRDEEIEDLDLPEDIDTAPDLDIEAPEADVAEQRQDLSPQRDEPVTAASFDADPADTTEQHRVVRQDEDDYR
jgi:hypothetical protein